MFGGVIDRGWVGLGAERERWIGPGDVVQTKVRGHEEADMRKMTNEEIVMKADNTYRAYVSSYGLRNAKKIVTQVARLLRAEGKRRGELEGKGQKDGN